MYHRLLVHVAWTTRDREPAINPVRAGYLFRNLPIIARQERARILEIGIVTTHLHLLVRVHPTTSLPKLLQRMKGGTAYGINKGSARDPKHLRWAEGYSLTSVTPHDVDRLARYVRDQYLHHPREAIVGWDGGNVALATSAEPSL